MYVRRWPRISASSRTPPTEIRSNFAAERARNGAAEARLADAGRTHEAEDRALDGLGSSPAGSRLGGFPGELSHREVLEDPVLDLLQVVVIGIQDLAGVGHVEVVLGADAPGEVDDPLQIGPDHAVFGRGGRQALEAPELAVGLLLRLLGQLGRVDPLAELVDLGLLLVGLAELVLDRLELLAQVVLALSLLDPRLDLGLNLGAELDHLELAGEDLREPAQAPADVDLLEQLLLLGGRDPQRPGDQMGQRRGVIHVGDRELQLLGQIGNLLDDLGKGALNVSGQRLKLGGGLDLVGERLRCAPPDRAPRPRNRRAGPARSPGRGSGSCRPEP